MSLETALCAKSQTGDADDPFAPPATTRVLEPSRLRILALDLGTKLGWATVDCNGVVRSGSANCAPRAREDAGQRWTRFRTHMSELALQAGQFDAVYFESVHRHVGTDAAHVYGGFLAHLEHWGAAHHVVPIGVGVGQIKKNWTGKGNAKKPEMIAAAQARGFRPVDDNEADALAILHLAITRENAK